MGAQGHALRLKNQREVNEALGGLPVPAFVFEVETGHFLGVNARFEDLIGYPAAELLRMKVDDIQPDEHIPSCHQARAQVPPQGLLRWQYRRKDLSLLNVKVHYREVAYVTDANEHVKARFVVVEFWEAVAAA